MDKLIKIPLNAFIKSEQGNYVIVDQDIPFSSPGSAVL